MNISNLTVNEVARLLQQDCDEELIGRLKADNRISIAKLISRWQQKRERIAAEQERIRHLYAFERLYTAIHNCALSVEYAVIDVGTIDEINIYQATVQGMYQVLANLTLQPQAALIDAVPLRELKIPYQSIINGDALSASIAAASIVAKVERDRLMLEYDRLFPEYGFAKNKGYATKEHQAALHRFGPCPIHRKSFEPVKSMLTTTQELALF
ncbi:MAG: Ribonuclease [Anaerospora sp.]|nr:Ribonuclease [Anaerospora sp.]